ncbi:putative reverse transcriptase domain-containing protein [Tanacetum coccineum]|uniref:Reverse transcriptase domain-containing protein n=1 Tax=Tanacetum coccineum TaxID=301880 RepID=A0ABQ5DP48_9ASTR
MATLIISISSDSLEDSVGSFTSRVVMFEKIPTVITVVLKVVAVVASPAGVPDLDIHTTSEADPSEDPLSSVYAPASPITSPFLHTSDSSKASDDSSGSDSFVSHSSLDSHEDIPLGRPFCTHPNGVLRMLTVRKRVHPFLVRIPVNRRRSICSVSSVATVALANVPGHATRDKPVPTADHSPTPSPSTGPSPKRCRSSATLVPLATPTPGALSSARADLLLPRKRIGGPSAALSSEDSSEESIKVGSREDIDSDVMGDIKVDITAEAATDDEIRAKTEDGFKGDDKVEDEAESSTRGTMEIGVDRSFVSTTFSSLMDVVLATLDVNYTIELADGRVVESDTILRGCTLNLLNHPFNINLIPIELGIFDVIIGMDWLSKYHALIVCGEKVVQIPYGNKVLTIHG